MKKQKDSKSTPLKNLIADIKPEENEIETIPVYANPEAEEIIEKDITSPITRADLIAKLNECLEMLKPLSGSSLDIDQTIYKSACRVENKLQGAIHHAHFL